MWQFVPRLFSLLVQQLTLTTHRSLTQSKSADTSLPAAEKEGNGHTFSAYTFNISVHHPSCFVFLCWRCFVMICTQLRQTAESVYCKNKWACGLGGRHTRTYYLFFCVLVGAQQVDCLHVAKVDVMAKQENEEQLAHILLLAVSIQSLVALELGADVGQLLIDPFDLRLLAFT